MARRTPQARLSRLPRTVFCIVLPALALLTIASFDAGAEVTAPGAKDRQIAMTVRSLLERGHLSRHPLDDEISARAFNKFIETLDPMKLYFTQSDIDTFKIYEDQLDDMTRKGDVKFAYDVFNRFIQRVDQRVKTAETLLGGEFDFTLDEELVIDPDSLKYPASEEEAADRWRRRIKYDLLVQMSDDKSMEEARERLLRRYSSFGKRMAQTDNDELLEWYLSALTTGYDPHTTYMSASTLNNFEIHMRLELDGIGAALQYEDGYTIVSKVIPGGAADRDGRLKVDDRITGVGQAGDTEFVDVVDMKLSDVVDLIRGRRGTVVRLEVRPGGDGKVEIYELTRDRIELKDSEARSVVFEAGQKADGNPFRVGVINLPSFYMDMRAARLGQRDFKSTTRDVRKILDQFHEDGVDAVVMDLRKNGGGSLTEAINLTGLFIEEGPVVQVKDAAGQVQHYDDTDSDIAWKGPLTVLVSKFSASASEIFAGAIQDYGRGIVVGDQATHGKGTVQTLRELSNELFLVGKNAPKLGALKITMQKFYRPSGDSTQRRGVISDIELPSFTTHMDVGEGDLDHAMQFDRVPTAEYHRGSQVNDQIIDQLRRMSAERLKGSEDFQKLVEKIERYKERKNRKSVTVNKQKFEEELADLNKEKEERELFEDLAETNEEEVVKRDFYFDEALAITVDFLRLMDVAQAN